MDGWAALAIVLLVVAVVALAVDLVQAARVHARELVAVHERIAELERAHGVRIDSMRQECRSEVEQLYREHIQTVELSARAMLEQAQARRSHRPHAGG